MKEKDNISFIRKINISLLMLLTVIGVVFNSGAKVVSVTESSAVEQRQESASTDHQQDQDFFVMAYEAIVPVFSVNVDVDLYTLFEAPLLDVIQLIEDTQEVIPASNYFNTLFRFIISTNAP